MKFLSFAFDAENCELFWVIAHGKGDDETFTQESREMFKIKLHDATMSDVKGETRQFAKEEAAEVHRHLKALEDYCKVSADWWWAGKGEKVNRKKA